MSYSHSRLTIYQNFIQAVNYLLYCCTFICTRSSLNFTPYNDFPNCAIFFKRSSSRTFDYSNIVLVRFQNAHFFWFSNYCGGEPNFTTLQKGDRWGFTLKTKLPQVFGWYITQCRGSGFIMLTLHVSLFKAPEARLQGTSWTFILWSYDLLASLICPTCDTL